MRRFLRGATGSIPTPFWDAQYNRIIDKDIQEIKNKENVHYVERVFGRSTEAVMQELWSIEDIILANFSNDYANIERDAIYRLRYEKDNVSYVVYTTLTGPYSLIAFLRMFVRIDEDNNSAPQISHPGNTAGQLQSAEIYAETSVAMPGFFQRIWDAIKGFFSRIFGRKA